MNKVYSYTPGPWRPGKTGGTVVADASTVAGTVFEKVPSGHKEIEYYGGNLVAESIAMQANINLIAAAPELLEALKMIYKQYSDQLWNDKKDQILQAIAKAEGRI